MRNKFLMILIITFTVFAVSTQVYSSQFVFEQDSLNLAAQDPFLFKAYSQVKLAEAWDFLNSREVDLTDIKVGLIDTGVDVSDGRHPEFQQVFLGALSPRLFRDSESDEGGHGTQVAGIIGANNISFPDPANYEFPRMNGILSGVQGLNYSFELGKRPSTLLSTFSAASTIDALVKKKVRIINMSFGTRPLLSPLLVPVFTPVFSRAFSRNADVLFVVGAGNFEFDFLGLDIEGVDAELIVPANLGNNLDNVITVGATDITPSKEDTRASFSSFGDAVNIAAPGVAVYSPAPRRKGNFPTSTLNYDQFFSGTSASAPMVTGVAAILKSINPELTPAEIKDILIRTADPISTDKPIGPRLNALRAVQELFQSQAPVQQLDGSVEDPLRIMLQNINFIRPENTSTITKQIDIGGLLTQISGKVRAGALSTKVLALIEKRTNCTGSRDRILEEFANETVEPGVPKVYTFTVSPPVLLSANNCYDLSFSVSGGGFGRPSNLFGSADPNSWPFGEFALTTGPVKDIFFELTGVNTIPQELFPLLPPASTTLSIATTTLNSITLSWENPPDFASLTPDFGSYEIFRSTSSPVTLGSTFVTSITNVDQNVFTDTNLLIDREFFYKVFVFDKTGLFSESNEVSATTTVFLSTPVQQLDGSVEDPLRIMLQNINFIRPENTSTITKQIDIGGLLTQISGKVRAGALSTKVLALIEKRTNCTGSRDRILEEFANETVEPGVPKVYTFTVSPPVLLSANNCYDLSFSVSGGGFGRPSNLFGSADPNSWPFGEFALTTGPVKDIFFELTGVNTQPQ